jgi:hypothetical protein
MAVLKLFQLMHPKQAITVLYTPFVEADYSKTLIKVVPEGLHILESDQEVLAKLDTVLQGMCMGMRLYIAGSEDFMWSVAKVANKFGIEDPGMMKELTGTLARPIYCVHCKSTTHGVTTNIGKCSGCGRMLFVRDHFSRQLGAYMGLMIDAESPGELPEIEEIYP